MATDPKKPKKPKPDLTGYVLPEQLASAISNWNYLQLNPLIPKSWGPNQGK